VTDSAAAAAAVVAAGGAACPVTNTGANARGQALTSGLLGPVPPARAARGRRHGPPLTGDLVQLVNETVSTGGLDVISDVTLIGSGTGQIEPAARTTMPEGDIADDPQLRGTTQLRPDP
jgi:hypothetical protein